MIRCQPAFAVSLIVFAWLVGLAEAGKAIDFARDVRPILASHCFACHGPDPKTRKAGLRLDVRAEAIKPGRSGAVAIVPGQAAASELVKRILAADASEVMPPPKSNKALQPAEKELLRRWIDQGAEYPAHWAFVRPVRPAAPAVKRLEWVRNEIDAFILARLEHAGLQPSAEAVRTTLVRRLSLDLRGLPPSLMEVDEFLADAGPGAYERLVERFLASPHYGEKMAQIWLDLARFSDTSGYEYDSTRQMWLWRDGVIHAFNANKPFDQFTIEQLAGDLLPQATVEQKIASGFNRNTCFNEEDGADPEEFVVRYTVDRTNTLGQVWLGLTLGCAECHSHKYDPISQKEYYQLYAFFTGVNEPFKSGNHDLPLEPVLRLPTREQARTIARLKSELAAAEKQLALELKKAVYQEPPPAPVPAAQPPPDKNAGATTRGAADDRYRHSQLAWEQREKANDKLPALVKEAMKVEESKRSDAQKNVLRDYYLRFVYAGTRSVFDPLNKVLDETPKKLKESQDAVPWVMVSEEMPKRRDAFVLIRGDFQQHGEKVEPDVPAALSPLRISTARNPGTPNRLDLARWLVRPDHPLTARVAVNRLWAQMFGVGLVKTSNDLGTQGEPPSHPKLLDWLAAEFVAGGWDVKGLLRKMALSATYRQSSAFDSKALEIDPHNRLLSRAARFRLSAEEVRDNVLAISGLLSSRVGGPSVMPYQPSGFYRGKYESWKWTDSAGRDVHRRGLYTFWRRTALHPMFSLFDAPSREECTVLRSRTNTPLQALVTLNDPTFVEAARAFAQRVLREGPRDLDGRLRFAFRCALARAPDALEQEELTQQFARLRARFKADPKAAAELKTVGRLPTPEWLDPAEQAAWTVLANLLLNLDETIMRE